MSTGAEFFKHNKRGNAMGDEVAVEFVDLEHIHVDVTQLRLLRGLRVVIFISSHILRNFPVLAGGRCPPDPPNS